VHTAAHRTCGGTVNLRRLAGWSRWLSGRCCMDPAGGAAGRAEVGGSPWSWDARSPSASPEPSSPLIKSVVVLRIARCWAAKSRYGPICCVAHEAAAFCQRAANLDFGQFRRSSGGIGRSAASNLRCGARFLPLPAEPTTAPKRLIGTERLPEEPRESWKRVCTRLVEIGQSRA
jgi:hypothetical protein